MKALKIYGIIIASALVVGVTTGGLIKRYGTEPERDYSGFDVTKYNVDENELISKMETYGSESQAYTSSSPVDLVNYSLSKYKRCENSYSFGIGVAATVVSQVIRNSQVKNGDTYFEESVSNSSMVHVAMRVVQEGTNGSVDRYLAPSNGVVVDSAVSAYPENPTTFTYDGYKEAYGRTPSTIFNYIIHKDSVTDSSKTKDGDFYKIVLQMNPDIATYNYQSQMKTLSNLKKRPTFTSCKLVFTLDEDLMLSKLEVNESYKAVMGIEASIDAHIEYKFFPNQYYKIPDIKENFDYVGLMNGGNN